MEVFWGETVRAKDADDKILWLERYAYQAAMAECFRWTDVRRKVRVDPDWPEVEFIWYVGDEVVDEHGRAKT